MIVARYLIGQRQRRGIENACLGAKQPQQAGSFLDGETRERPLTQRSVEQKDTWRGVHRAEAQRGALADERRIERRQMVRFGQVAERHQAIPIRSARAASVMSRTGTVSVTPTRK
jgi:hypothetical protein